MTIPASQIVSVTPRVINAGGTDLETVGLILTENPLAVFPNILTFTSAAAVGDYFGTTSDEYQAAVSYFLGYDNSFKKPTKIKFARLAASAIAGSLIGGPAASLTALQAITAGSFDINIDGETKNVTELNLSSAETQSQVAEALQSAITGVTVTYNSNLNAYIITSSTTGATSAVSAATDGTQTPAALLGLTAAAGAVTSSGSAQLTPAANMASIVDLDQNWATFTTLTEQETETILAFAEWVNGTNCQYLYVAYTSNANDVNPSAGTNLPLSIAEANYEGVALCYNSIAEALLAMAIVASIDWNRNNGLVTLAFKAQTGITPSVTDETTAANCNQLNVNYYGKWATRNDDFTYLYDGAMAAGNFGYIDAYIGNLWLRNALQVSIMSGLTQVGRIPYTDAGYAQIRAWCIDPINRGLNNGVIDPGVTLSESQKAQLISEIGEDVSSEIFTKGYYLMVNDPGAAARVNRESPLLGLWYTYGGSVHKVDLPVSVIL